MKPTHLAILAATALAMVAGTAGCGNDDKTDHSAHTTTSSAQPTTSTTVPATVNSTPPVTRAPNTPQPSPVPPPSPNPPQPTTTTAPPPSPEPGLADVDCGPVTDAGGGTRTVVAVAGSAGRVGCTEAINVASAYVTTVSTSDVMTVDGWQCNAQPDAATPSMCAKDGLVIALRAN